MNQQLAIDNIKKLYEQDDIQEIITRTVFLFKSVLNLGYNVGDCYFRTHDLGIKPNEMGISIALALKQTDDSKLTQKDLIIKKVVLKENQQALSEWEKGI